MRRLPYLVLALSLGLNAGLIYVTLNGGDTRTPPMHGAGRPRHEPARDPELLVAQHVERMSEDLSLSSEQQETIRTTLLRWMPEILAQQRRIGDLRRSIVDLYVESELDSGRFQAVVARLSEAQARLDSLATAAMLGEAEILTREQRTRYVHHMPWGRPHGVAGMRPGPGNHGHSGQRVP
jgi:Spy/CpxP family protein refolding chaperone